jgi:hypothetical protein
MNKPGVTAKRRKYAMLAIETLELPTSGVITNWVNDKFRTDIEKKFSSAEFSLRSRKELNELKAKDLKDLIIEQRGMQLILSKLRSEGLLSKNRYDEYSLAQKYSSPLSELNERINERMRERIEIELKERRGRGSITIAQLTNGQWVAAPVRRQGSPVTFSEPIIFGSPTVSRRN